MARSPFPRPPLPISRKKSSNGRLRTQRGAGVCGSSRRGGKLHNEARSRYEAFVELNIAAVVLNDDLPAYAQPEPAALPDVFGREERVEYFRSNLGRNSGAVVRYF